MGKYYPILVDLKDKKCLVVGAGEVGVRKIQLLLNFNPKKITVIDPYLNKNIKKMLKRYKNVEILEREFIEKDLEDKFIVVASTNSKEINLKIADLCNKKNILCNVIDNPKVSSFIVPATVIKEDLVVTISTSGASPALAKKLKQKIESFVKDEYILWLKILKKLRPMILELGLESRKNKEIFKALSDEKILNILKKKEKHIIKSKLAEIVPSKLKKAIGKIVDECFNN